MRKTKVNTEKAAWSGKIVSIQPHIRLMRSFDERSHSYLGYLLRVDGIFGEDAGESVKETVPVRSILLRPEKLRFLPGRTYTQGAGA
jgi:hypothetical protein